MWHFFTKRHNVAYCSRSSIFQTDQIITLFVNSTAYSQMCSHKRTQTEGIWSHWLGNWMWLRTKDGLCVTTQSLSTVMIMSNKTSVQRLQTLLPSVSKSVTAEEEQNMNDLTGYEWAECEWSGFTRPRALFQSCSAPEIINSLFFSASA